MNAFCKTISLEQASQAMPVTLEEAKAHMAITTDDFDSQITNNIHTIRQFLAPANMANTWPSGYLNGGRINEETWKIVLNSDVIKANEKYVLCLKPIQSVVLYDSDDEVVNDRFTLTDSVISFNDTISEGSYLTITAGYSDDDMPQDLKQAIQFLTYRLFDDPAAHNILISEPIQTLLRRHVFEKI